MTFDPRKSKLWSRVRRKRILARHQAVADYWLPLVQAYVQNADSAPHYVLRPRQVLGTEKIIWQYWGQGLEAENLPEVVRLCFASVDAHKGDYRVVRLTDETLTDYVDLPDFVLKKRDAGNFSRTAFSDLLRLALLNLYGGVWLDATVCLTGNLPPLGDNGDFFMYQRDSTVSHKAYWEDLYAYYWGWYPGFRVNCLNAIIYARPQSEVLTALCDLLLHYWQTREDACDYFFFQILFDCLMQVRPEWNCPIVSDTFPHLLQMKLNGHFDTLTVQEILRQTPLHKLTYFDPPALARLKGEVLSAE